jgi:hypothetical protein
LEHRYAATVLAAVLSGDPVTELGDRVVPMRVRLQASDISPVDDLVVEGRAPDGGIRRVSVGVRRDPALTTSDSKSVPLVRSFLLVVTDHWESVTEGRWRVAMAVGVPSTAVQQTEELARIAQSVPSASEFREAVARQAATNEGVRRRLRHVEALVTAAATGEAELTEVDAGELTWRWLWALRVRKLRLEGVDETDRTFSVSTLRQVVADGSLATADAVFAALAELAGGWASAGARVDQAMLRRALSGFALSRSGSYEQAWSLLDGLARRLRDGLRPDLAAGEVRLELDRDEERSRLVSAIAKAGRAGSALVVEGEPDVGKSALTLRAAEHLTREGAAVMSLSLRDLPPAVVEVERLLGHRPVADVLAAGEVRPVRLLVIDGAESVMEGRGDLLREFAAAALRAGVGVVAVTRTDGAARVREVLRTAASLAGDGVTPAEYVVARLAPTERQTLVDTFRPLIRLGADARWEWLVGRPGLVDVLLRAGTVVEATEPLSEAAVFVAVWNGLVRNDEARPPEAASPDDRERAALAVARRVLNLPEGPLPGGAVWAELRSDGVLRAPANPALAAGDEFATDLIRDFALCRLFLTAGWEPLRAAEAPRWTIRAVRLACQAKLLSGQRIAVWRELRRDFEQIGEAAGERWAEVPVEALLTLGDAQTAMEQVWDELVARDQAGVKMLLRLAQLRYVTAGFGDPFTLAPVVAVTHGTGRDLGQHGRLSSRRTTGETIRELVLAWLRGMVRDGHGPDPLRQQVRDRILSTRPEAYDEFAVEALAMLGPDTDDRTEQWLRAVAADDPDRLCPAIESAGVAIGMSQARPQLLLDLTEAYYIIKHPDPDDDLWSGQGLEDEGIRDYKHGLGFDAPAAAWYYGPFFRLLNTLPVEAMMLINRMLDHAANARVRTAGQGPDDDLDLDGHDETNAGIDLDLLDIGPRHYVGDEHVWGWYRGSTTGPYPCMSALLAVERFADHLISNLNPSAAQVVVHMLLRDCHNLAMPGLVVGLLIRHRDKAADLLDPWLSAPDVWSLEFARATSEGLLHVQGPDSDDVVGRERRRLTPRDVAAEMVVRAMAADDQPRLDALSAVADRLLANAQARVGDSPDGDDQLIVVQGWASALRPENYHTHQTSDGSVFVQYKPPEPIASRFAPTAADLHRGSEALRLQSTYAGRDNDPDDWPVEMLAADIVLARRLVASPPVYGPLHPEDPIAAVAAAAITSHARGRITVDEDDLRWAADTVLTAAMSPRVDPMSHRTTIYPMAADRTAARAVPSLLLPAFDHLSVEPARINQALHALATSPYDEVRTAFVTGSAPVWTTPCSNGPKVHTACRRHVLLWAAAQTGLGDCRLGPWDQQAQRRLPKHLPPPYADTLPLVPQTDLLVDRLTMPIACAVAALRADCVSSQADTLLPVLLDAHRRGTDHRAAKNYRGRDDSQRELVARALIDLTLHGQPEPLVAHLRTFAANANALQQLLRDLATLSTYDYDLRQALPAVWPLVLRTTLDAIDAGADLQGNRHWVDYALGALLPSPQIRTADTDPDRTLRRARVDWLTPETLNGLVDRWLALATGEPKAADAIAQFARTTPTTWQATTGLEWLERVINNRYDKFANRCRFVINWLTELRETTTFDPGAARRWRSVVDGLAAAGDSRAVDLQRIDE